MNFEGAKENIQPLAAGRNVEQLEVALNAESHQECQEELLQQRKQFEQDITNYGGDDPLDLWFEYITWVEQSYPKSGKESSMDELLKQCLSRFEKDARYTQDPRFIRLFIKYIDTKANPHLYYSKLYNKGVGTMVADLYIAWAHYFGILDNFEQAKAVYQKGLDARAAPVDQLKQIYERFQFSVGQRVIRKEEYRQEFLTSMEAQRNAFTSLRSLKRSKVGSIRTGSAVKSFTPGQVRQNMPKSALSSSNASLKVYDGASSMAMVAAERAEPPQYQSVVEEIEHSMAENNIEPGPWSKASSRRSVYDNVSRSSALKMAIHEDDIAQPPIRLAPLPKDERNFAINLPKNFARKNCPQTSFIVPPYVEDIIDPSTLVRYPKFYLHPNEKVSFQPEELRHYLRLKRLNTENDFTKERDAIWGSGTKVPSRVLANFPRKNQPQTALKTEHPDLTAIPSNEQFAFNLAALYPTGAEHETTFEDFIRQRWIDRSNTAGEMDETVCVRGRQSFGVAHVRRSIVACSRKSIMPLANDQGLSAMLSVRNLATSNNDSSSDMEIDDDNVAENRSGKVLPLKGDEMPASKQSICTDQPKGKSGEKVKLPEIFSASKSSVEVPAKGGDTSKKCGEMPASQWSIFTDDQSNEKSNEKAESPQIFSASKSTVEVTAKGGETSKKCGEMPAGKWSIFTDDQSNEKSNEKVESPQIFSASKSSVEGSTKGGAISANKWSIFTDDQPNEKLQSPETFSIGKNVAGPSDKELFAVPQRPLGRPTSSTERRTLESPLMKTSEVDTQPKSALPVWTPYPFGPQTGVIKKQIRKSSVTENSIPVSIPAAAKPFISNEIPASKSPVPDLDFSLCTQAFNVNLAEQMVSTPVALRRSEPLTAHQETQMQPLKLSTIMETTEGSTHTASTKSSIQFSSPEEDDVSKRSNTTIRTKLGGATVCHESETTGVACKNAGAASKPDAIEEVPMHSFANAAGATNYSCSAERTLPAIQMSLLTATQAAPKRVEATTTTTAKDVPAKSFPFSIFEDTQTTTTIGRSSGEQGQDSPTKPPKTPSIENNSHRSIPNYQFNRSSFWIKDEPKSFTLVDSVAEESYALPPRPNLTVGETVNDVVGLSQMEASVTEESFALPTKSLAAGNGAAVVSTENNFLAFGTRQVNDDRQMDASVTEESFALPTESFAPGNGEAVVPSASNFLAFGTRQVNDDRQMDASVTEKSCAAPRSRISRKSMAPAIKAAVVPTQNNLLAFGTRQVNEDNHMDASVTEESFALPTANNFEAFGMRQVNDDGQMDASVTEESFVVPRSGISRKSIAPANRAAVVVTENNFASFGTLQVNEDQQVNASVTEESFAVPRPRKSLALANRAEHSSVTEESFAFPSPRDLSAKSNATVHTENNFMAFGSLQSNDGPHFDASVQPNVANGTYELDDVSDSVEEVDDDEEEEEEEEEEEIILVPDETMHEDVPRIVAVQSLATQDDIYENRAEMTTRVSISLTEDELAAHLEKKVEPANFCDQSIYYKHNSILAEPSWIENDAESDAIPAEDNVYQHPEVNLEESRLVIETKITEEACDPFDEILKNAILQEQHFADYLTEDETSEMVYTVPTVTVKRNIAFNDSHFEVLKCIGHGAYGRVYSMKHAKSGRIFAAKKEIPANLFEAYILREVHRRIVGKSSSYMKIDMSIIGNNGSLLFSQYSPYGTLLDVCNRVFTSIKKNVDETIVCVLAYQMLGLIDDLHKAGILHCDLKPDNFLVMKPMTTNHQDLFIQLIDFENAVDLHRFPPRQQFTAVLETKNFVCLEMLEKRPWCFQPDLFCLAATIHSVLFGKYMEIVKNGDNFLPSIRIPRYFNVALWGRFFNEMINIPSNSTPDLEVPKGRLHEAIVADKKLEQKIQEFNKHIIH